MIAEGLSHGGKWLGIILAVAFLVHASAMAAGQYSLAVPGHGCVSHDDAGVVLNGDGKPAAQLHCAVACVCLPANQSDASFGAASRNVPRAWPDVTLEGVAPPGILRPPKAA